nr:hypothetical protein A4A49_25717 [Ipomoea batatas]
MSEKEQGRRLLVHSQVKRIKQEYYTTEMKFIMDSWSPERRPVAGEGIIMTTSRQHSRSRLALCSGVVRRTDLC